ncbi:MAG: alanine racemase [Rhodospirillaceae bacterium]
MIRQTAAHVDLGALAHNARAILDLVATAGGRAPGLVGVVKANAYGHGAAEAGRALLGAGARMLACADLEEAAALRRAGLPGPILVFGALGLGDLDAVFEHGLTPTIASPTSARRLQAAAEARGVRLRYHLEIDTGMNRLGFRHDNLARTMPELLACGNLELEGVYTHFATADVPGDELFARQRRRFDEANLALAGLGARGYLRHAANSAALLAEPSTWFDLVRPGLLLYGVAPPQLASRIAVKPVMSLRSRVAAVKGVRPGEIIGYGGRFTAERPTTMAVVPAGYADGIDWRLAGRGWALVRGRRAPIVGSVCMDMITLDVTGIGAEPGDEVALTGRQGADEITVEEVAGWAGTIPYELLCRVGARVERVYTNPAP